MGLPQAAAGILWGCWAAFFVYMLAHHVRVRRKRGAEPPAPRPGELRAPVSMLGLFLEGVGVFLAFWKPRPLAEISAAGAIAAIVVALLSVALAFAAIRRLGMQWRIKAVVTQNHELVTSGPYAFVRHPILLAFLGLTFATGLLFATEGRLALAVIIFLAGTEIRVRAEDRLLRRRFGEEFESYRSKVPAYLPFLR